MPQSRTVVGVLVLVGLCSGPREANASLVFTADPVGAWKYYYQDGGPGHFDPAYFSTSLTDVSGATFEGMVVYNSIDSGSGVFGPGYEPSGSTYRVFTTYLTSATDQTIRLGIAGDDGHSLFVNGNFAAGAGFGGTFASPNAFYDLPLTAGVEVLISLVGHDAYGGSWVFGITDPASYRGITLSAVSTVPEPSSLMLFGIGALTVAGRAIRRRRVSALAQDARASSCIVAG